MKFLEKFGLALLCIALVVTIVSVFGLSLYRGEYVAAVCILVFGVGVCSYVKAVFEFVWYDEDDYTAYPDEDKNVIKKS